MLLISFNLGKYAYAMRCDDIVEITPFVDVRKLTGVPEYVAGVIDYRGRLVPTIDMCMLAVGRTSEKNFGTRILVVDLSGGNEEKLVGLIAENVTNTIDYREEEFEDLGIDLPDAPYMGKMFRWNGELVQLIDCHQIVNEELQKKLFEHSGE